MLVSLDVESLNTNIPIYLALKCVTERWDEIKHLQPFHVKHLWMG